MTPNEQIAALLQESQTLSPEKDSARLVALYAEAAALVDRSEKPKKWAAFRFLYGQAVDPTDPRAALAAYRDAAGCLDPVADRAAWSPCTACIGLSLVALGKAAPPESEEVIQCLEATIDDFPYNATTLALYYGARVVGDPQENWKKRVQYLELALEQVSPQSDAVDWATQKNALAVTLSHEPDGDFAKAMETRILFHQQALAVVAPGKEEVGSAAQNRWILICADTSEAYLNRVGTEPAQDQKTAERIARDGYQACGPSVSQDTRAVATLALARALLSREGAPSREHCMEGLRLCDEAAGLIDDERQPVFAATNQKFKALSHLNLLKLGEPGHLEDLLQAAESAYTLSDPVLYPEMRRVVMQVAAEALVTSQEFSRAVYFFRRAVQAGESVLQRATSRAGRLESIFDLHDSYAQLGYCLFQTGAVQEGVEAIDRGKGRLWRPSKAFATFAEMKALAPKGGALLFAAFAPKDGAVAVVTERGEQVCPLAGFGRERLRELLLGDVRNPESGSWITRYIFRNANPAEWREKIDSIGKALFDLLWAPLTPTLDALGVKKDAELVWFPQAGLGILPLHAAWTSEDEGRRWIGETYAVRYAPSTSCLIEKRAIADSGGSLVVSNPAGDLAFSALELAWVREADPTETPTVLAEGEAVKKAVVSELMHARRAHLSTHAIFRVDDPFQSGFLMANGEMLSLEELLPLIEKNTLREVVLTGCETAMAQVTRRPDEQLGFPAAFLEHGAATVAATQWPVDDWAAAALVGRFYREWRHGAGTTAAQAMRRAQNWMRNVSVHELSELLRPLKEDPGPLGDVAAELRTSLRAKGQDERPFAHPYYWAAFTVSGL